MLKRNEEGQKEENINDPTWIDMFGWVGVKLSQHMNKLNLNKFDLRIISWRKTKMKDPI